MYLTTVTISSEIYPREARERDLVEFLARNKNKAYNYADIALAMRTNIHTAQELVRELKKEGKILVKYINESRHICVGVPKRITQKIAYITINRGWLNKHKKETWDPIKGEQVKVVHDDDEAAKATILKAEQEMRKKGGGGWEERKEEIQKQLGEADE